MRRILIVDDSKVMQRLVAALLEEIGADLSFASSGEEALYAFQQGKPDVVVTDVEMGGMNGVELARRVRRESGGRTRVVLMSAGDMDGGRAAVKRGDADAFFPKPLDGEGLRRSVVELLPPPTGTDVMQRQAQRIRVLVADDTEVGRRILTRLLRADPDIEVVGVARDGTEAVTETERLKPNLVLLDAVMPGLDGVAATRQIMQRCPVPVVLVTQEQATWAASTAFAATQAGAVDFVVPPPFGDLNAPEARSFREKLKDLAQVRVIRRRAPTPHSMTKPEADVGIAGPVGLVAICGSTGGPAVLARLLSEMSPALPHVPVLVVQHIMAGFGQSFVEWLSEASGVSVRLAVHDEPVEPGCVLVAPDARHMLVSNQRVVITDDPPISSHRPSGTPLFESAARAFGSRLVAVLLTGMGEDGVRGLSAVREHGGTILVQSPDTCVVPGMPESALRTGLVSAALSPDSIARRIVSSVKKQRGVEE